MLAGVSSILFMLSPLFESSPLLGKHVIRAHIAARLWKKGFH